MTEFTIVVSILAAVFFISTVVMAWYSHRLLKKLWVLSSNVEEAQFVVANFREHVNAVHGLETFYGDPTLQNLLEHAQSVSETLGSYDNMFSYLDEEEEFELEEEETDAA
tara:strand:- start:569 stop:898 length:330 start_codon:yes stop_codon:yes gene_type:complete